MTLAPASPTLPTLLLATGPLLTLLALGRAGAPRFPGSVQPATVAQGGMLATALALGLPTLATLQFLAALGCEGLRRGVFQLLPDDNGGAAGSAETPAPLGGWAGALALALPAGLLIASLFGPGGVLDPWLLIAALLVAALTERAAVPPRAPLAAAGAFAILLLARMAP